MVVGIAEVGLKISDMKLFKNLELSDSEIMKRKVEQISRTDKQARSSVGITGWDLRESSFQLTGC